LAFPEGDGMKRAAFYLCGLLTGLALAFAVPKGQAHDADQLAKSAPQKNPLFLNMTSGESWRGWMGLHFAHATLKQGHPVAVFLNLDAVKLAAKNGEPEMKPSMQRAPKSWPTSFATEASS
jgi:hypothetical protein